MKKTIPYEEPATYVKIFINTYPTWCEIRPNTDMKNYLHHGAFVFGNIIGKELKTGKFIEFSPSDVVAFYVGKLSDIGLGMPYIPTADVCTILDTIVPDSMAYETHIACRVVQEIIGKPLHEYVAEKLHYTELELCRSLSAEQVDAVALCIYNIEKKNQGMIIGDQTGIGKGRVAAAMIRYGFYNGLKPIFLSEKPNLFTDIYRDLVDIGSSKLIPFIVNGKEAKTDIKDEQGNIVHTAPPKTEQDKIFKDRKFPAGYDFACATYTQFNSVKDKPIKPNFLRAIAQDNLIIMDEAHNASGSSNTGEFLQEVLIGCKGVVFLSATFAKRPDNMPVYALKTCISEANMSKDELVEAIIKGGVALQEVLAAQLVSEGQMIRRERSFEGVEVNYFVLTEKEKEHKAIFDNITEVLRGIIEFQEKFITDVVKKLDKIAAVEGKEVEERKGTSKAGVDNAPFFSKVFQVINQILFSLKAVSVAEMAIQRLEEGKKPIIAFSSTMESFFDDMLNDDGNPVMAGDTISIDFKTVLKKGLDGVMRYTVTDINGSRQPKYFTVNELDPEGQSYYYGLLSKINTISTGISISPIDIIKNIIRKAGYMIDEVTGRKFEVQIIENKGNGGNGVLMARKKVLANDAFRMYNNNELDCLMINQSGSTGASAHAIVTKLVPKEKVKQRVMIILQPELDINREVQKRGRINRTGQIIKPIYDYVSSCVPAERRLMMMLRKKLKSLDANTTSNQKQSDNIMQVDDFLNKYGDKVVADYLIENPLLNAMLGDPLDMDGEDKEGKTTENAASKVSGRVAVLSTDDQERFYTDILERYSDYVNYLRQADKYDLEVESLNLESETLESKTVIEGKNGKSVFSENTSLETCEINVLKKPFTKVELTNLVNDNLKAGTAQEQQQNIIDEATSYYSKRLALDIEDIEKRYDKLITQIPNEKGYEKAGDKQQYIRQRTGELNIARNEAIDLENQKSKNRLYSITNYLRFFFVGKVANYPTFFNETVKCVCLGFNIDKKKPNPFAPSALKVKLAIANCDKYIDLTLSGEPGKKLLEIMGASSYVSRNEQEGIFDNWEYYTRSSNVNRRKAFIVTGNILQAFSKFAGKLISFTTKDGSIRKGILLPENFDPQKNLKQGFVNVPIAKAYNYIMEMGEDASVSTPDQKIMITHYAGHSDNDYYMSIPATKNFKDIFEDTKIIKLCNNIRDGFEKRSDKMIAYFRNSSMKPLIEHLQEKYNFAVMLSDNVYSEFVDKKKSISVKTDVQNRAEKTYQKDKDNFEARLQSQSKITPAPHVPSTDSDKMKLLKLKLKMKAKALQLVSLGNIEKKNDMNKQKIKYGDFGKIFTQFEKKPTKAIKHLMKVKEGECINALYRDDIGYIDIVWGENDKNNIGFGLKHIIGKHGDDIKELGYNVEDFIPIVVQFGNFNEKKSENGRKVFESEMFRFIVETQHNFVSKNWLLTAFDLRKKPQKSIRG